MGYVIRVAVSAVALWISTLLIGGITLGGDSTLKKIGTLVAVAIIFGLINAVLRPLIKTIGCAFYLLSLGLIAVVVNGLLFLLASWFAGQLNLPFHVDHFWPDAVLGALIVGVLSWAISAVLPDKLK